MPARRVEILVAQQMKHAVNEVTDQFGLPGSAKPPSLSLGFVDTNENLAVQNFYSGKGRGLGVVRRPV